MKAPARTALVLLGVVVVLQTAAHLVLGVALDRELWNVNGERTVPVLVGATALLVAAAGSARLARLGPLPRRRGLGVAAVLVLLAVDEVAVVHERVGYRAAEVLGLSGSWDSVLWPLAYVPLLGGVLLLLWQAAGRLEHDGRRLLRTGLALLVTAVALEVLSAPFSTEQTAAGLVHALEGAVEEACEVLGWGAVAIAGLFGRPASGRRDTSSVSRADSGGEHESALPTRRAEG